MSLSSRILRFCTGSSFSRRLASTSAKLLKTTLYDWHVKQEGKFIDFCGYALPVQYKSMSIIDTVLHCRKAASLFDVSHMGQVRIRGDDRVAFLESLTPANVRVLKSDRAVLTQLTTPEGGIRDDTIITNRSASGTHDMVVNACVRNEDIAYLEEKACEFRSKGKDVSLTVMNERALIALQGPKAAETMKVLLPSDIDLSKMPFMSTVATQVAGVDAYVTRCGYTGEDGFEVSMMGQNAEHVADSMMGVNQGVVVPTGLGARDVLRLEAGLCLMGSDMTGETTPIAAGLNFTIGKRRRQDGGFPGDSVVCPEARAGHASTLRVGMIVSGAPARGHEPIVDPATGKTVGVVTSGTPSPCLGKNIAMGYVPYELSAPGTKLEVVVRKRARPAEIVAMPFVPTRYFRVKK